MADRPRRQEQERASSEVTEVAPGVLRAQLPIDMPGLGHVNCYVLEDERGVAIVDPGLPGRRPYAKLVERLASGGHPDAARAHRRRHPQPPRPLRRGRRGCASETGAEIVTHERFRLIWDRNEPPDLDVEDVPDTIEQAEPAVRRRPWDPPPWGGEGHRFTFKRRMRMRAASLAPRLFKTPVPSVRLADARGRSSSPGGSGSRCTRRATPRTTSACSTRPRA